MQDGIRVFEFFSGIGGMRLGLPEEVHIPYHMAFEVSPVVNEAYRHNFGQDCNLREKLVEHSSESFLDGSSDLWMLSPPCQPYTKTINAKQKQSTDLRAKGFHYLIKMLGIIKEPPKWIFLENVKTFEGSDTLKDFEKVLKDRDYSWQCYVLSPMQFGIPNNRTRFYMICERNSNRFQKQPHSPIYEIENHPKVDIKPLGNYLLEDELSEDVKESLRISEKVLGKTWAKALSVVGRLDHTTFCFTKGYGKVIHKASGSFLYENATTAYEEKKLDRTNMLEHYGKIRAFHPRELLNLFGFPQSFSFPDSMTFRYQYQLIGNSVNVTVVAALLRELLVPKSG